MILDAIVHAWLWFMATAFIIAFIASMPPRRPLATWLGDLLVRWGLAGILVWFVVNGLWAVRELMGMKLVLPFSVVEGYLEHATVWGAVFTGVATFIFFGSVLLLNAIFSKPTVTEPLIYYRQVVFVAEAAPKAEEGEARAVAEGRKAAVKRVGR